MIRAEIIRLRKDNAVEEWPAGEAESSYGYSVVFHNALYRFLQETGLVHDGSECLRFLASERELVAHLKRVVMGYKPHLRVVNGGKLN